AMPADAPDSFPLAPPRTRRTGCCRKRECAAPAPLPAMHRRLRPDRSSLFEEPRAEALRCHTPPAPKPPVSTNTRCASSNLLADLTCLCHRICVTSKSDNINAIEARDLRLTLGEGEAAVEILRGIDLNVRSG